MVVQKLNQVTEAASGLYICNVDNDVMVSPNWLLPMVELAEKEKDIGIVSPELAKEILIMISMLMRRVLKSV